MSKLKLAILAAGFLLASGNVNAIPILGSIGFTGDYKIVGGTSLADATGIDIISAKVTGTVDGSFAAEGISAGDAATYNDFTIGAAPINDLWSVGSFSFDLSSMMIDFRSSSLLALSGAGVISSTDPTLDATFGDWVFTANSAGTNFTFSSSSSSTGDAVPEPNVTMLLGLGLLCVGAMRKLHTSA